MTALQFWNWFSENKKMIEDFISSDIQDYTPYEILSAKLKEYHDEVIPELTIDSLDNFVLILSCDGIRAGVEPVEELYATAPLIDKWIIQKYRAPGSIIDLNFKGLDFKAKDIKAKYFLSTGKIDIELYIKGYSEQDSRYKNLAFLYLDHLIGEYLVMTKVGAIEFKKLGLFSKTSDMVTLPELCELIKALV
jgi:hypothetical protein